MTWDSGLDGVHHRIAAESHTPVHVLAGPGTGKTFAMMRRIARLLEEGGTPDQILAVSFTRTAARDLTHQLAALGVPGAEDVRASTLHSLCYGILQEQAVFDITGRIPRSLLSPELGGLVNDLAGKFGGKRGVKSLLEAYEAGWARLQHEMAGAPVLEEDQRFAVELISWLRYHRAMLIGELVPLTLTFLEQNPNVPVLPNLRHVLVDEYQDLNRADQALIERLSKSASLAVIGDDNQSIYSFRYANPEAMCTFPATHDGCVQFVIEECRRCPPNIVAMSNSLIRNNPGRSREVPLVPMGGRANARVYLVQHRLVEDEIGSTADFLSAYLKRRPDLPPGQVLVLAPRRFIGHAIRLALTERGFNALSYFFEDELKHPSAAEGFCLLTLLVNPSDRPALRAWLNLGQRAGGHAAGYARVRAHANAKDQTPKEVCDELNAGTLLLSHTDGVKERYRELVDRLQSLRELSGLDLVRALWNQAEDEITDIRIAAERIALENPEPLAILEQLSVDITQPELPGSNSDIIRVMSLHKSKGLTASCVAVIGCVAGALPTLDVSAAADEQERAREEQRRLFYVAVTRATNALVVSSSSMMEIGQALRAGIEIQRKVRHNGVTYARTVASPYVAELGAAAPRVLTTAQWRQEDGF